jgi:hypothetical protein
MSANSVPSDIHIENVLSLAQKIQKRAENVENQSTIQSMQLLARTLLACLDDLSYSWQFESVCFSCGKRSRDVQSVKLTPQSIAHLLCPSCQRKIERYVEHGAYEDVE